jgi:hypothetical protein
MSNLQIPNLFNNVVTTAELSKLDQNFQQIADHVNTNFNALEAVEATQSLNTNGYQKLPGGLIMQWGMHTTTQIGNTPAVIDTNFPTPFPTACLSLQATSYNTNISIDGEIGVNFNNSAFGVMSRQGNGASVNWLAIGY